jgi:hypothetical protein
MFCLESVEFCQRRTAELRVTLPFILSLSVSFTACTTGSLFLRARGDSLNKALYLGCIEKEVRTWEMVGKNLCRNMSTL